MWQVPSCRQPHSGEDNAVRARSVSPTNRSNSVIMIGFFLFNRDYPLIDHCSADEPFSLSPGPFSRGEGPGERDYWTSSNR